MQQPGSYNFEWIAGTTAVEPITISGVNLTGATIRMQIRKGVAPDNPVLEELVSGSEITITDGANGEFSIEYDVPAMSAATWTDALYGLNVEFSGGTILPYLVGKITIKPGYVE